MNNKINYQMKINRKVSLLVFICLFVLYTAITVESLTEKETSIYGKRKTEKSLKIKKSELSQLLSLAYIDFNL